MDFILKGTCVAVTQLLFAFQTCINPFIYARSIPAFSKAVRNHLSYIEYILYGMKRKDGRSNTRETSDSKNSRKRNDMSLSKDASEVNKA